MNFEQPISNDARFQTQEEPLDSSSNSIEEHAIFNKSIESLAMATAHLRKFQNNPDVSIEIQNNINSCLATLEEMRKQDTLKAKNVLATVLRNKVRSVYASLGLDLVEESASVN